MSLRGLEKENHEGKAIAKRYILERIKLNFKNYLTLIYV